MLRVLILNFEYPPIGGGGATATQALLREFSSEDDLEIDLVTSSTGSDREVVGLSERIRIIRLPVGKQDLHYWREGEILRYIRSASGEARRLIRERPYHLCHAIFGFPAGWIAYRLRGKLPYIVSLHGSDVPGFNERFKWHYPILKILFKRIWKNAKAVTVVSDVHRDLARQTEPSIPFRVIPNGVDTQILHPLPDTATGGKRLLSVCRLIRRKNIHVLIDAMPEIREKHPTATLTVLGGGEMLEELRSQVRGLGLDGVVTLAGRIPNEELPSRYQHADIFVLPSDSEGMSITLLEAMATGLPIVVTDTGGTKELVEGNGLIIRPRSKEAIVNAVDELLSSLEKRGEMGAISRKIASRFSWPALAAQYRELYKRIATE